MVPFSLSLLIIESGVFFEQVLKLVEMKSALLFVKVYKTK